MLYSSMPFKLNPPPPPHLPSGFPLIFSSPKFLLRLPWTSNKGDFTLLHLPRSFCYLFSVKQLSTSRTRKKFLKSSCLVDQYISVFRNLHYRHENYVHALGTTSLQLGIGSFTSCCLGKEPALLKP